MVGSFKEEFLKRQIIEQNRHHFIYGYNNKSRSEFINSLVNDYPITMDVDRPMAIYLENIGLPKIENYNPKDSFRMTTISREYLYFCIADSIINASVFLDKKILNKRLSRLFSIINGSLTDRKFAEVKDIDVLYSYIKETESFYLNNYLNGTICEMSIKEIALPFLQLELFIDEYKKSLNNDSYFGIIVDKKSDINNLSIRSINDLIGSRINNDISMKIFTEPNEWQSYIGTNGILIQNIHDYGSIELDDSYDEYMKKLTRRY